MKQWDFLEAAASSDSVAHAYLFYGNDTALQEETVTRFVQHLFCLQKEQQLSCGVCRSCSAVQARVHPDVLAVVPTEGKEIKVEQIRAVHKALQLLPYEAPLKVVHIKQAHLMNTIAQSAFLKVLEEPAGNALIILTTEFPDSILATLRSRTQQLAFYAYKQPYTVATESPVADTYTHLEHATLAERFAYAKTLSEQPENIIPALQNWLSFGRFHLLKALIEGNTTEIQRWKRIAETIQDVLFYTQRTNVNARLALEHMMLAL